MGSVTQRSLVGQVGSMTNRRELQESGELAAKDLLVREVTRRRR